MSDVWVAAMRAAMEEARGAVRHGDVPVGAVLVDPAGSIVAADHNRRQERGDATAHAELLVIRAASEALGTWRLDGHTLVVNLEPCPMCAMAAVWARLERIVYGTPDPKAGGVWSLYNLPQDARLNHRCDVVAGVLASESREMLESFFKARRGPD